MAEDAFHLDSATHRQLGVDLFNHAWSLLRSAERTPEQDAEMTHAAHASRWHWAHAGAAAGPQQLAVGEWQCARVYAVLGRGEPALHHARASLAICDASPVEDWVRATALEALARATWVAGDLAGFPARLTEARRAAEAIADAEDREVIEADLRELEAQTAGAR